MFSVQLSSVAAFSFLDLSEFSSAFLVTSEFKSLKVRYSHRRCKPSHSISFFAFASSVSADLRWVFEIVFISPHHTVHAVSLFAAAAAAATCHNDNTYHLIKTVQLFCWYCQLFLLAVCFVFGVSFFYLIFLFFVLLLIACQSHKRLSKVSITLFFCSSNISVPTSPLQHLLSCELHCEKSPQKTTFLFFECFPLKPGLPPCAHCSRCDPHLHPSSQQMDVFCNTNNPTQPYSLPFLFLFPSFPFLVVLYDMNFYRNVTSGLFVVVFFLFRCREIH